MPETAPTPTAPETVATPPANTDPAAAGVTPAAEGFKSEESKQAVLADLARERDARQALTDQLNDLRTKQEAQNKALAAAFGLAEDPKPGDDITETVNALKARLDASELEATRLRVAAEHNIPADYHDLLTETDTEKLSAQAKKVGALIAAKPGEPQNPAFQANPGQGQNGAADPSAADEAEYERFYPSTPNGK